MKNIKLTLGGRTILDLANLKVQRSEIHALFGEHGSGKTSIGHIICGNLRPDSGDIFFDSKDYDFIPVTIAHKIGIEVVEQNIDVFKVFTIAEFFALNQRKNSVNPFFLRTKNILAQAQSILSMYDIDLDPLKSLQELSHADQVLVYILKAINYRPKLLILDEALYKLVGMKLDKAKRILESLKNENVAILYMTQNIDDIFDFVDTVTIIKHGHTLLTRSIKEIDKVTMLKLTYTQIEREIKNKDLQTEFYQFLKYNETILQDLPLYMIVVDAENRLKFINKTGKKHFSIYSDTYLDLPLGYIFSKGNKKTIKKIESELEKRKENSLTSLPIKIKEEETLNDIKFYPVYDGPSFLGNIIILEDITLQERLREQVILSEKLASIGLLAAGVAHEINNPLEIIYNYLRYLKYNSNNKDIEETIDALKEEIEYIANIVSNLINFSSEEIKQNEEIELSGIVEKVLHLVSYDAQKRDICIKYKMISNELYIDINRNEIKQILLILLKNSFEAMSNGGTVSITLDTASHEDGEYVRINISDTGIGVEADKINDIFLPFFSIKKDGGQHMGLGLSICYGIVKKYGGKIFVENLDKKGTLFTVLLPSASKKF